LRVGEGRTNSDYRLRRRCPSSQQGNQPETASEDGEPNRNQQFAAGQDGHLLKEDDPIEQGTAAPGQLRLF
jgi:hypothetical protein